MRRAPGAWRVSSAEGEWKQMSLRTKYLSARRWAPAVALLLCLSSLLYQLREQWRFTHSESPTIIHQADWRVVPPSGSIMAVPQSSAMPVGNSRHASSISHGELWGTAASLGWRPSCTARSSNWLPPKKSNGYLLVRCNGGLNQQRTAICNAVVAARIMNATLVLPALDTNAFWNDRSGFSGIYDDYQFINTLRNDVRMVHSLPATWVKRQKNTTLKPFQLRPPRDAPENWYLTSALEEMKKHGAVYLTPFSHRLSEELDNHEYQRLRCRANFHALRFNDKVRSVSNAIVQRLRSAGNYMAIHLRFEMDMLAFAGCLDIFSPEEQEVLRNYRKQNFAVKKLEYVQRRLIGKCPLTPEEVGLMLRALGFNNSTRIYLASGEIFVGERFMKPLKAMFPLLETRTSVATEDELKIISGEGQGLLGSAVDYMVCLLSDIFVPTYDGPSNFANNLLGHRLYYGFRRTIQPDRKALAPLFIALEKGALKISEFEAAVREAMSTSSFGSPHARWLSESFYTNPWPECFCSSSADNPSERCPSDLFEVTKSLDGEYSEDQRDDTDVNEDTYDEVHEIQ